MEPLKLILRPVKCEAVLFTGENLSEVKHFCTTECTITYEICSIEDYWSVQVYDFLKGEWIVVAIGDYIVKIGEDFTVVDKCKFEEFFDYGKD